MSYRKHWSLTQIFIKKLMDALIRANIQAITMTIASELMWMNITSSIITHILDCIYIWYMNYVLALGLQKSIQTFPDRFIYVEQAYCKCCTTNTLAYSFVG